MEDVWDADWTAAVASRGSGIDNHHDIEFPPIYYGEEGNVEKYSGQHVAVLMAAAFGLGFMFGVAIYFIVFIMCCLEPASAYSDDSSEHPFEDRKQRGASSPTLSVHYV